MEPGIEAQIREWRSYLLRRQTIHHVDVNELEDHLRSEMSENARGGASLPHGAELQRHVGIDVHHPGHQARAGEPPQK